jgi:hypothetical protein
MNPANLLGLTVQLVGFNDAYSANHRINCS